MKQTLAKYPVQTALVALSAVLFAVPFHISALWVLSFVAACPLFLAVKHATKQHRPRRLAALGAVFGFVYHLCLYHWLLQLHPLEAAGITGLPSVAIVVLAYVGASLVHAGVFALVFWLYAHAVRRVKGTALCGGLFVAAFLAAERLTDVGQLAFPWSRVALPLADTPVLMRLAAVLGPYGTDALVLSVGVLLALSLMPRRRRRVLSGALALFFFFANLVFGLIYPHTLKEEKTFRVAVVQTAYASEEKWGTSTDAIYGFVETYTALSAEAGAEIVVFPESVLATPSVRGDRHEAFFASLCEEHDVLIVAGSVFYENAKAYNAVCLYDGAGLVSYGAKRNLVPFGEYLPYEDVMAVLLPAVANMDYYQSSYSRGENGLIGEAVSATFGAMVCFDTLFTDLSRDSVNEGAELFLVPSNLSWFKESNAAKEHLWHTTYRAVESGRDIAQSANVGASALLCADGTVLDEVDLGREGIAVATLTTRSLKTPYVLLGDVITPVCFGALALSFLTCLVRSFRAKKGNA